MSTFLHIFLLSNFKANWAEIFIEAQETIIYRLVMKNLSDDAFFPFLILLATFSGKME